MTDVDRKHFFIGRLRYCSTFSRGCVRGQHGRGQGHKILSLRCPRGWGQSSRTPSLHLTAPWACTGQFFLRGGGTEPSFFEKYFDSTPVKNWAPKGQRPWHLYAATYREIWSGVLTSTSSRRCGAVNGSPLPEWTDFGPHSLQLDRPTYALPQPAALWLSPRNVLHYAINELKLFRL